MDTIRYFKSKAKNLLKAYKASDASACQRIDKVLPNNDAIKLQNAQHIITVEAGFKNWGELLNATEIERQLAIVMDKEPILDYDGVFMPMGYCKTIEDWKIETEKNRVRLRKSVEEITWTVSWLTENILPIKTINTRANSYLLKHIAENSVGPYSYLSNGVFIAAAIIAGYPYKFYSDSHNACFGMSQRSLKRLSRQVYPNNFSNHINVGKDIKVKTKPNPDFKHPMADFVLRAFEKEPCQDIASMSVFLSGATNLIGKMEGMDANKAYRIVAADVLGVLKEKKIIEKDFQGWFRLVNSKNSV